MPCELKTKMIGNEKWSCMQMSATRALLLESRLLPAIMQGLGPLLGSIGQSDATQVTAINQAFSSVAKAIPPAEFAAIIRELCEEAMKDGQRVEFETTFSGGKGVLLRYQVAWFVLEANFSELFLELAPEGAAGRAKAVLMKKLSETEPLAE